MGNKVQKQESEVTTTLPVHLIMDNILPRLPVKPLTRFKCVSKYWLSTISSREFTKIHLEFSFSDAETLILQEERGVGESNGYYLSFDENYNINEFVELEDKYPLPFNPHPRTTRVAGSCNGLLCMYNKQLLRIYLWNPATHQCRDTYGPVVENADNNYKMKCLGFGYVSSIDDYRIGCLLLCKKKFVYHVFLFSLRTGEWNEMATLDVYQELRGYQGETSVFIDDTIYWAPEIVWMDRENYIIGLNLVRGEFKKIPMLDDCNGCLNLKIFEMKGCLALCCIEDDVDDDSRSFCDVWMLKQHDDESSSWEMIFSISIEGTNLVYLFETGKLLVSLISYDFDQLMLYYPSQVTEQDQLEIGEGTVIWKALEGETFFHYFTGDGWGYFESLISPFGTNLYEENGADHREQIMISKRDVGAESFNI